MQEYDLHLPTVMNIQVPEVMCQIRIGLRNISGALILISIQQSQRIRVLYQEVIV